MGFQICLLLASFRLELDRTCTGESLIIDAGFHKENSYSGFPNTIIPTCPDLYRERKP